MPERQRAIAIPHRSSSHPESVKCRLNSRATVLHINRVCKIGTDEITELSQRPNLWSQYPTPHQFAQEGEYPSLGFRQIHAPEVSERTREKNHQCASSPFSLPDRQPTLLFPLPSILDWKSQMLQHSDLQRPCSPQFSQLNIV